jgi:hypothetical protein
MQQKYKKYLSSLCQRLLAQGSLPAQQLICRILPIIINSNNFLQILNLKKALSSNATEKENKEKFLFKNSLKHTING